MTKKKNKLMDTNKGIWIPMEILQMENLTSSEKIVYAFYLQLTENTEKHQAIATNEQICEVLGMGYRNFVDKIKPSLKVKGLISSNGIATKTIQKYTQNQYTENTDTNYPQNTDTDYPQNTDTKQEIKQDINKTITKTTSNITTVTVEEKSDVLKALEEIPPTEPFELYTETEEEGSFQEEQKQTADALEERLSGLTWGRFNEEWKKFISKGEADEESFQTFMKILPSKTKFLETTEERWRSEYTKLQLKREKVVLPSEFVEYVKQLASKGQQHSQIFQAIEMHRPELKMYANHIDNVILEIGFQPYGEQDNGLPF